MIARGVLTGYAVGAAIALYPGQLPRVVALQAALTVIFGAAGALVGWALGRRGVRPGSYRVAMYVLPVALVGWLLWQNRIRGAAGLDPVGPVGFAVVACAVAGAPFAAVALRRLPRRGVLAGALAGAVVAAGIAWPATAEPASAPSYAQRFADIASPTPGVRAYASLSDGASAAERATVAVDRLIAAGGLARRAVVIAVPTGSGWVDPHFVRGVETSLHGDSAVLAVQYTQQPSWQSFLLHRDAAAESARAAIDALHRRAPSIPVRLYGQSLGAVGVVAAQQRAAELGQPVAGALQAGTPAAVPVSGPALLNPSDPVGIWSARLLVAPPDRRPSGGRPTPRPAWLPGISFVQATVDLLSATAPPPGLGHRYDERQGSELVADLAVGEGLPAAA